MDKETGQVFESYTMLTINADGHPIMGRMHRPHPKRRSNMQDKRSVVPIALEDVNTWLTAPLEVGASLVRLAPAEAFDVEPICLERAFKRIPSGCWQVSATRALPVKVDRGACGIELFLPGADHDLEPPLQLILFLGACLAVPPLKRQVVGIPGVAPQGQLDTVVEFVLRSVGWRQSQFPNQLCLHAVLVRRGRAHSRRVFRDADRVLDVGLMNVRVQHLDANNRGAGCGRRELGRGRKAAATEQQCNRDRRRGEQSEMRALLQQSMPRRSNLPLGSRHGHAANSNRPRIRLVASATIPHTLSYTGPHIEPQLALPARAASSTKTAASAFPAGLLVTPES